MGLTQVKKDGITWPVTNAIMNADVNTSAAIALSKLSISGTGSSSNFLRGDGSWQAVPAGISLSGSTNNTIATVTGANALQGEANLTFDGTNLGLGATGDTKFNLLTGGDNGISLGKEASGNVSNGDVLGSYAFQSSLASQTTVSAEAKISAIAAEASSGTTAATDLAFFTKPTGTGPGSSPSERLRITSAGKIGIGETVPDRQLHVKSGSNSDDGVLRIESSNGNIMDTGTDSTGHFLNCVNADPFRVKFAGTEKLRITSDGKIGINQVPTRELSLHSPDNNNALIHFTNDDTGETASDGILIGLDGNEDLVINNQESSKNIKFFNNSEVMRITGTGHVGIGSTSPYDSSWGAEATSKFLHIKGSTYGCLSLEGDNTTNTKWTLGAGDSRLFHYYENQTTHVLDLVGTTKDVEVGAGNLRIMTAGKGIDFSNSATSFDANQLHEYEEGTFTPRLGGSNIGTHSISGTGKYTRIGRLVHCEFKITNQDLNNSATGQVRVDGWPYGIELGSARPHCGSLMSYNVAYPHSGDYDGFVLYGETSADMYGIRSNDDSGWTGWDVSNFHPGGLYFEGTFTYMTTN